MIRVSDHYGITDLRIVTVALYIFPDIRQLTL